MTTVPSTRNLPSTDMKNVAHIIMMMSGGMWTLCLSVNMVIARITMMGRVRTRSRVSPTAIDPMATTRVAISMPTYRALANPLRRLLEYSTSRLSMVVKPRRVLITFARTIRRVRDYYKYRLSIRRSTE